MSKRIRAYFPLMAVFMVAVLMVGCLGGGGGTDPTYTLTVTVTDADGPVAGANVAIAYDGTTEDEETDAAGEAVFEGVSGEVDISVTADGYEDGAETVNVTADRAVAVVLVAEAVAGRSVESVDAIADIEVDFGTTLADIGLPDVVGVSFSDGSDADVPVDWGANDYNPINPGGYIFRGDLNLAGLNADNPDGLQARVRVEVANQIVNIVSVAAIADVEVAYGTAIADAGLPALVRVTLSNGNEVRDVPVDWDTSDYDSEVAGTYTFAGTLDVSGFANIENPNGRQASIRVVVAEEVITGEISGTLNRIYAGGGRMTIDGRVWDVRAMPGLNPYLDRMSAPTHVILGSEVTVFVEDGEITDLIEIVLSDREYTHTEMNDLVNTNAVYGLTIRAAAAGSSVVAGAEAQADVGGNRVLVRMNQLHLIGVNFDVRTVEVDGDDVVFEDVAIEGNLDVGFGFDGFAFDAQLRSLSGNLDIRASAHDTTIVVEEAITGDVTTAAGVENSRVEADSITGNVTLGGAEGVVTAESIAGNLIVNGADNSLPNLETIDGDLTVAATGSVVFGSLDTISGNVVLNGQADLAGVEMQGDLTINGPNLEYDDLNLDGMLEFGLAADNVTITNSTFGLLSDLNNGGASNIVLSNVTFVALYQELSGGLQAELEEGDLFTINAGEGWVFENVTWPQDDEETLAFDITINANRVQIVDSEITGDLTINNGRTNVVVDVAEIDGNVIVRGNDATVTVANEITGWVSVEANDFTLNNATVAGVTDFLAPVPGLERERARFNDVTFAGTLDLDDAADGADGEAPQFVGGAIENGLVNIPANTSFSGVTFDFDSTDPLVGPVVIAADGVEFTGGATFTNEVIVNVNLVGLDEEVVFSDVSFVEQAQFNVLGLPATAVLTVEEAFFGGEVAVTFAGAGRINVGNGTEFEFDPDANEDITINDVGLSIFFDGNAIYRPVTVTNVTTARFREGSQLFNDLTVVAGDVRLIGSRFTANDDITITHDSPIRLTVNGMTFEGPEDVTITGGGDVALIATVDGGDVLTVNNAAMNVLVSTLSSVRNAEFTALIDTTAGDEIADDVEFSGLTLEGLETNAAELTLNDVTSSDDVILGGADLVTTNLRVTGATSDLTIAGADAVAGVREVGRDLVINGNTATVTVSGNVGQDLTITGDDARVWGNDVAGNVTVQEPGAVLNDLNVAGNVTVDNFDEGMTTFNDVSVTGTVDIGGVGGVDVPADREYNVTWTGGSIADDLSVNIDASPANRSSNVTFTNVDFAAASDFQITQADTLRFVGGTIEELVVNAGVAAPIIDTADGFVFDGVTFSTNDVDIDANAAAADFVRIIIDEVALFGAGAADVSVSGGVITDLVGNNFANLSVTGATVQRLSGDNELDFAAEFDGVEFQLDPVAGALGWLTILAAAEFENSTFHDPTVIVHAAATFNGDTFHEGVGIWAAATLRNIVNAIGDADTMIVVGVSVVVDGWTFEENGDGELSVVLADNVVLTLLGDINWVGAPELSIDASNPGASVNDDNATWIPGAVEILAL